MINYKGSIMTLLFKTLEANEEMTFGEVLYSFLGQKGLGGKHFVNPSDQEIYTALERFFKKDKDSDDICSEEEFENWINKH